MGSHGFIRVGERSRIGFFQVFVQNINQMSRSELSSCRDEGNCIMGIAIEELESFLTQVKHERAKVALQRAISAIRSELDVFFVCGNEV